MCPAQRHNKVTPVRLEAAAARSQVKHSTTEPLCSPMFHVSDMCMQCRVGKEARILNRYNEIPNLTQDFLLESDKCTKTSDTGEPKKTALSEQVTTRLPDIEKRIKQRQTQYKEDPQEK